LATQREKKKKKKKNEKQKKWGLVKTANEKAIVLI
jgi:hypothetical protein